MKALARLTLCIAIILLIPAALFADSNRYREHDSNWSVTGRVISAPNDDRILDIYDNIRRHCTVIIEHAKLYDTDREIRFREIHKDDLVQIYGQERIDGTIEARSIYRLDRKSNFVGDTAENITIYGVVKKVDKDGNWLDLKVGRDTQRIKTAHDTKVIAVRDHRVDVGYLHKGDEVRVEGFRSGRDVIIASTIFAGAASDSFLRNVSVRVTRQTSIFDRRLRVTVLDHLRLLPDVFDINVAKETAITQRGRGLSVHDIRTGDILCMEGVLDNGIFTPMRILVNESEIAGVNFGRDYHALQGTIKKIDYTQNQFLLDAPHGDKTIYADRARVWIGPDVVNFESLHRGDEVMVRGNTDRNRVDAERIEIVRRVR